MIKYLVMDVDGTLTDGKIYMGNDGEVMKSFSIKDGYGIHDKAIPSGIVPIIITGRSSKILENRCKELGISRLYQGVKDKANMLSSIVDDLSSVAYIGDDENDIPCMKIVSEAGGLVGCPADADTKVVEIAHHICNKKGGDGAVRDFVEWILERNSK